MEVRIRGVTGQARVGEREGREGQSRMKLYSRRNIKIVIFGITSCCKDRELTMDSRKLECSAAVAVQHGLVLANAPRALVFCASSKPWILNSYIAARASTRLAAVSSKVRSSAAVIGTLSTGPDRPLRCC